MLGNAARGKHGIQASLCVSEREWHIHTEVHASLPPLMLSMFLKRRSLPVNMMMRVVSFHASPARITSTLGFSNNISAVAEMELEMRRRVLLGCWAVVKVSATAPPMLVCMCGKCVPCLNMAAGIRFNETPLHICRRPTRVELFYFSFIQ